MSKYFAEHIESCIIETIKSAMPQALDKYFELISTQYNIPKTDIVDIFMDKYKHKINHKFCDHIDKNGKICGTRIAIEGRLKCSKHKKYDPSLNGDNKIDEPKFKLAKMRLEEKIVQKAIDDALAVDEVDEIIDIKPNKWGYYMDEQTKWVFHDEQTVCGKQNMDTGDIIELELNEHASVIDNGWMYDYDLSPKK